MDFDETAPASPRQFRRRDILVMGTVLAATPLLGRAARASSWPASDAAIAEPALAAGLPLSIGYIDGTDAMQNLRRIGGRLRNSFTSVQTADSRPVEVVPASSLTSGDPTLVNGLVKLRVHGLFPGTLKSMPSSIDLDIEIETPELGQPARFFAWSYRAAPRENLSAPVTFRASPDWQSRLSLIVTVRGKAGAPPATMTSTFTLGSDGSRPRLVRGAYLVGVMGRPWDNAVSLAPGVATARQLLSLLVSVEPVAAA